MITAFGMTLIFIITIALSIRYRQDPKKRQEKEKLAEILKKAAAYQFILMNTVLTIPLINISIIALYCTPESSYYSHSSMTCYQSSHLAFCFLAAFTLLVVVADSLIFWFLFYTKNPFSKSFYAVPNNLFRLAKLAIKIAPPVYWAVDSGANFQDLYIFLFVIMQAIYLIFFRMFTAHNYKEKDFFVEFGLELFTFWFSACNIIFFYLK